MRKFLLAMLVLLLASPVSAGWNLKQNDDGTTEWVRDDAQGIQQEVPVNSVFLTAYLENVSTASSMSVAIPLTNMRVLRIISSLQDSITAGDAVINFYKQRLGVQVEEVTNTTGPALTIANGTKRGETDTFTPTDGTTAYFQRGESINIVTDGGSTNDVDVHFTIHLVPR